MNRQAVFDKVKTHLLAQGKKAFDPKNEDCLYRGPNGTKCAIGCLIKDKFYSPDLENLMVRDAPVQRALAKSGIKIKDEDDENFLAQLQRIHDHEPIEDWPLRLARAAQDYKLTP